MLSSFLIMTTSLEGGIFGTAGVPSEIPSQEFGLSCKLSPGKRLGTYGHWGGLMLGGLKSRLHGAGTR